MITDKPNAVRGFITTYYGTYENLAKVLNIATGTVGTWAGTRPRGLLKYAPEICSDCDIDANLIVRVVRDHIKQGHG
jgi:hypothetical protein